MFKIKNSYSLTRFAILLSILNFVLYHFPFFRFVANNVTPGSFNGIIIILSLVALVLVANFFAFYLFLFLSKIVGKSLLVLFFVLNSICVYFANTYHAIIDESMIGNV
ncbi:MAG: phosphoethanolamine transferase, partial [Pseudopedobacter saltans]